MALPQFKSDFLGTATKGVAALGLALAPISGGASAQDAQVQQVSATTQTAQCSPLFRTSTGREVNARMSAHVYSQQYVGAVGISIFPGQDLSLDGAHSAGAALVDVFKRSGIEARCFVHNERGPEGSGFNYKIDGQSWNKDGPMNIVEASDVETLRGVAAEARTARALLASQDSGDNPSLALNR